MRALTVALSCAASHAFRAPLPRKLPTTTRTAIDDLYTSKGVTTTTTRAAVAPRGRVQAARVDGQVHQLVHGLVPRAVLRQGDAPPMRREVRANGVQVREQRGRRARHLPRAEQSTAVLACDEPGRLTAPVDDRGHERTHVVGFLAAELAK